MQNRKSPFNTLKLDPVEGPQIVTFGTRNAKLQKQHTATFALPAGYTCPGACDCLAHFDRETKKIVDGPEAKFRCYAASMEAARPSVRTSVDRNLSIVKHAKTEAAMADVLDMSLPARRYFRIRVHWDGDFFSAAYFRAWMRVAERNPERLFYAYTKNLPVWVTNRHLVPENFVLTASRGGKWDDMIEPNKLRQAVVVFHPREAARMGLEIDHDDSHARDPHGGDFALLIHGMQPTGSEASEAVKVLKKEKVKFSYSTK